MKKINLLLIVFLSAYQIVSASGGNRNGTGGAAQLLIPAGVRGIALGGSNVSLSTGLESLFWNPAGLTRTNNSIEAAFSHMSHIADIGVSYGAVSADVEGVGMFALSIKSLSIGEIDVTTVQHPDGTGQKYTPQMLTAGISFAKNLSDRVSVGLTANLINETLSLVSSTGVAFNIGVMYSGLGGMEGLSLGLVMKNIGPPMKYSGSGLNIQATSVDLERPGQYYKVEAATFELPSSLEIGMAYKLNLGQSDAVLLSSTFQNNNFSGDYYKVGAEYNFQNLLSVRGGYILAPEYDENEYVYGLTAGLGTSFQFEGLQVKADYAYRDVKYFGGNHVFGITFGF